MRYMSTSTKRSDLHRLVACNVYVTAGGQASHIPLLTNLLREAQDHCTTFMSASHSSTDAAPPLGLGTTTTTASRDKKAVVVHAYVDTVYNRSSFHVAGDYKTVAQVATKMIVTTVKKLRTLPKAPEILSLAHPYIGLVDHVAVMPLEAVSVEDKMLAFYFGRVTPPRTPPAAKAAKTIGNVMRDQLGIYVFLYGDAHSTKSPSLAAVRRTQTKFFESGGLSKGEGAADAVESATVGATANFVENFNILLRSNCSKKLAQDLTKRVRERNGGLEGVEALTLPYSNDRYEVACNLLRPDTTGATAMEIQDVVDDWELEHGRRLVERGYRVGTTAKQCLQALDRVALCDEERQAHDDEVAQRFRDYFDQRSKRK
jgi:glutamate formiminotransferase